MSYSEKSLKKLHNLKIMIKKKLIKNAKKIDEFLLNFLKKQKSSLLVKPMKYSLISGGKKIRSTIILDSGKLFKINEKKLINICAAVECIHSYSLIHDDLPCMDNDAIRRGKPSTHIKYGEASAVLAGSSLLTLAFEIITDQKYLISSKIKSELARSLASCSGHTGIAEGQELDLKFEKKKKKITQIIDMQKKKTGKLFYFCLYATAVVASKNEKEKKLLSSLGEDIGLLFQLSDDFLDKKGSSKLMGKPVKKDNKKGKSTLLKLMGDKKAFLYADNLKKNILRKLVKHGKKAEDLINTINFIFDRKY
jgi:farnesyl diphosphate synthase